MSGSREEDSASPRTGSRCRSPDDPSRDSSRAYAQRTRARPGVAKHGIADRLYAQSRVLLLVKAESQTPGECPWCEEKFIPSRSKPRVGAPCGTRPASGPTARVTRSLCFLRQGAQRFLL